ncbi:uncharacterized protein LOC135340550 [Halichondria panicea]|uniref:uncharacterized protein LOC135340550 n=1 Tax=Halichondria panicea TaxID=6063 RepID=UPI00312B2E89
MPSGGGGAGAGGGGSGGGGGGGFGGGGISFGGYDGGKLKAVLCFVVNLVIVILVIGSLIGGVLSSRSNSTDISTSFYSPGDSRLLFLSSFFCDGGSLELSSNSVNAELLLVDSTPPLDNTNNFTITVDSSFDPLEFQFWQYHLHPNSNITLSIQTNFLINVYIIKGNDNANRWRSLLNGEIAEEFLERITTIPEVTYQVETEDEYYIFIYNSLASRPVFVSASLTFERFEYSAPAAVFLNGSCVVREQGHCTVPIPYNIIELQEFLVIISMPAVVDYGENIQVSLDCEQRGWAYAVVILVPMAIGITIFLVSLVLLINSYSILKPMHVIDN